MEPLTKEEAIDFFSKYYFGQHHIPGYEPKQYGGYGWCVNDDRGGLATYDFNRLTRLVVMAHDMSIRVEIVPVRNNIMKICIWKRKRGTIKDGLMSQTHPTLEDHITVIRDGLK